MMNKQLKTETNGCIITVTFNESKNENVKDNILGILVETYEKRVGMDIIHDNNLS